jgi:hypothetical protein
VHAIRERPPFKAAEALPVKRFLLLLRLLLLLRFFCVSSAFLLLLLLLLLLVGLLCQLRIFLVSSA